MRKPVLAILISLLLVCSFPYGLQADTNQAEVDLTAEAVNLPTVTDISLTSGDNSEARIVTIDGMATCSGVGDADLSYAVDVFDCVYIARAITTSLANPGVTVSISDVTLATGATGSVALTISGVSAERPVSCITVDVKYDPSVVEVLIEEKDEASECYHNSDFAGFASNIQNSDGYTRLVAFVTAEIGLTGEITVADICLKLLGGEKSALTLDVITLKDDDGQSIIPFTTVVNGWVIADDTPPTVVSTSPADGAPGVAISSDISVTFSEAMDTSSAEDAFSMLPSVSGLFSWSGKTMTFDPTANLDYGTEYAVTIAGTATDLAHNGLDGDGDGIAEGSPTDDYSWSFTVLSPPPPPPPPTYYSLTVTCDPTEGGTVSPPGGDYPAGTTVELTATPNADYAFGSWSDDLTGSTNPDTITMDSDKSVTADFVSFTAPADVAVSAADPGVDSIDVSTKDLGEVDTTNMPEILEAQEAYVVDSTGTGSFTLRFTDVANAENIVVYKVVDTTWTEIPITAITVIVPTTVEVTMEVGDPILVFGLPTGVPPAPPIEDQLAPIAEYVQMVYYFDNATKAWSYYWPGVGKTLDVLTTGSAYWINVSADCTIDSTLLYAGWNLIGW